MARWVRGKWTRHGLPRAGRRAGGAGRRSRPLPGTRPGPGWQPARPSACGPGSVSLSSSRSPPAALQHPVRWGCRDGPSCMRVSRPGVPGALPTAQMALPARSPLLGASLAGTQPGSAWLSGDGGAWAAWKGPRGPEPWAPSRLRVHFASGEPPGRAPAWWATGPWAHWAFRTSHCSAQRVGACSVFMECSLNGVPTPL